MIGFNTEIRHASFLLRLVGQGKRQKAIELNAIELKAAEPKAERSKLKGYRLNAQQAQVQAF